MFFHLICFSAFVERLMTKVCQAYLAHIIDTRMGELKIKDIPVVSDYLGVFLNDIPGLSLLREIDFTVELIFGTTFISQVPYMMPYLS